MSESLRAQLMSAVTTLAERKKSKSTARKPGKKAKTEPTPIATVAPAPQPEIPQTVPIAHIPRVSLMHPPHGESGSDEHGKFVKFRMYGIPVYFRGNLDSLEADKTEWTVGDMTVLAVLNERGKRRIVVDIVLPDADVEPLRTAAFETKTSGLPEGCLSSYKAPGGSGAVSIFAIQPPRSEERQAA